MLGLDTHKVYVLLLWLDYTKRLLLSLFNFLHCFQLLLPLGLIFTGQKGVVDFLNWLGCLARLLIHLLLGRRVYDDSTVTHVETTNFVVQKLQTLG